MKDFTVRAAEELKRWRPVGISAEEIVEIKKRAKKLVKVYQEVFKEELNWNQSLVQVALEAVYGLLSPLEVKDFDEEGKCERAKACYRNKDGKYISTVRCVYVYNNVIDKNRPQSSAEFPVPGMPPQPIMFHVQGPCGQCKKDFTECLSCANVVSRNQ